MKFGIDIRMMGNSHGGIGRYVFELVKHLLELDAENDYCLFYNRQLADPADVEYLKRFSQVELVEANIRHYSVAEQVRLPRILSASQVDVMHFPNFNVPVLYKKPFIVTIHDVIHHKLGGVKKSNRLHFTAYKKVIERAAKNSSRIITVSEQSKREICDTFGVPPAKVSAIYEGSFLDTDVPDDRVQRVKRSFRLNRPYFLFVGVLQRNKNVVGLTRGFDEFIRKYRLDMDLVVVGKADPHYPDVRHHALDIQHRDRLVFTGYVDDKDLAALYRGAHAFVSASLYEGFGLPGVEAMQFGLPLAVSNIEVFNEIYDNAAVYFDPQKAEDIAEKMRLLSNDAQFHNQQQQKSLQRSTLFDWKKTAKETLEIYEQTADYQRKYE